MTAAAKAKTKRARRYLYAEVRPMIDSETGEERMAFVAQHPIDRRIAKGRKFKRGETYRIEVKQARNPKFWRKAHVLGGWLAENTEGHGFEGLAHHDAVKRLQTQSGVGVMTETFEIPGVGQLTRNVAEPLDFDSMDESRFNELWDGGTGEGGWIGWLRREVFGGLDAMSREEVEEMITRPQA